MATAVNMKILKIIAFSIIGSLTSVSASQLVPPSVVALKNVANSLRFFKQDKGGLPDNWDDFIKSGYLSGDILQQARDKCDLENRYRFFGGEKKILIPSKNERIIIMAKYPGLEGDHPGSNDPAEVHGRFLFVETADGGIETRRYSEVALKIFFADAGLNLQDYTVEASSKIDVQINERNGDSRKDPLSKSGNNKASAALEKNTSVIDAKNWGALLMSVFSIIAGGWVYILLRRKKHTH